MKWLKKNKKILMFVFSVVVLLTILVVLFARSEDVDFAAKFDNEVVSYEELDENVARTVNFYNANDQDYQEQTVREDTLDQLIRRKLIESYAKNNNINISQDLIDGLYKQRFDKAGSEEKLLNDIGRDWGLNKQDYIDNLYYDLLRDEVQNSLNTNLDEWIEQRYSEIDLTTNIE